MTTFYDSHPPSDSDLKRSEALCQVIRQVIAQEDGAISFSRYMEMALYHPKLGYYQSETFQIGKSGDFTTAPEISPLYAHCLAKQCQEIWDVLPEKNILEVGAGSGQMAVDLISQLDKLGCLPEQYFICEISSSLRKQQQKKLKSRLADFFSRIHWIEKLPENFTGVILANEVLDALPVNCFQITGDAIQERCVSWEADHFSWQLNPPDSEAFINMVSQLKENYHLTSGYMSEINLALDSFIQSLARCLKQGVVLLADYGYGQAEYYHPQRRQGTLTCFYQHHRHDKPLILTGLQDMTCHVDFSRVIELASAQGFELLGFTTQAAFLLGCGLLALAEEAEMQLKPAEQFALHQAIKTLTLPSEMGDRIKIMGLGKKLDALSLMGFQLQDRRRDL